MTKIIITPTQLNEIMTVDYDMKNLKKVQRKIYNSVSDYCGKMHSDDAWQDVGTLIKMIKSVDGVEDVYVGSGEYANYLNPEDGACRDYETTVLTTFGKLYGYIRCHAAGTRDDIFKYYDMTISLYPDKKKDMEERLESMNEVAVNGGTVAGVSDIKLKLPNIQTTGNTSINFQNSNPAATAPAVVVPKSDITGNTLSPNDETAIKNSANITVTNESRKYSKRQVELGRMLEMRKNGKVYSKKQLNEMFMEVEDITEKLKQCPAFDVMTTFGNVFGVDAEEEMMGIFAKGGNPTDFIVGVYNEADPKDQQMFKEKLGI